MSIDWFQISMMSTVIQTEPFDNFEESFVCINKYIIPNIQETLIITYHVYLNG